MLWKQSENPCQNTDPRLSQAGCRRPGSYDFSGANFRLARDSDTIGKVDTRLVRGYAAE